jgi:proteasome accessory factor B
VIALLRGPSSYNARRLAEHFGASIRNIYRDIAVLELAGVPVYYDAEFGTGGGYRIRSDWWFPHVGLTDKECLDLAVLTRAAENRSIPLLEDVSSVRDKLLGTLPVKQQDLIRTATELYDVLGLQIADHSNCRSTMTALQTALLKHQQIEARYRSPHQNKTVKLRLEPQRIFLAGPAWYLAARDTKDAEVKLFRVARFQSVKVLNKPSVGDRAVSLRQLLGNAWCVYRGDRDWHVEIAFAPEVAELVAETRWHHTQELEQRRDGSLIFRATVSGLNEVVWWVLGWGERATVLKPKELADEVQSHAQRVVSLYQTSSTGRSPAQMRANSVKATNQGVKAGAPR